MTPQAFKKELEAGLPAPAYLIAFTDDFFIRNTLEALKEGAAAGGFSLAVYDLEDKETCPPMARIIDELNTAALFSRRTAIALRGFKKLKKADAERLDAYLLNPSESSVLMAFHLGEIKYGKPVPVTVPKGFKALHLGVKKGELPAWVDARAKGLGITIKRDAIRFLSDMLGDNLLALDGELFKLSLCGKKEIDMEDVNEMFFGSRDADPFRLFAAIIGGDARAALTNASVPRDRSEKLALLGAVNYKVSQSTAGGAKLLRLYELLLETNLALNNTSQDYPLESLVFKLLATLKRN
jgi:DNA polymerase-3 subunit delta